MYCIFQANAVRGVIAAVCCATFFIVIGLVYKFRWRPPRDDLHRVSYTKRGSGGQLNIDQIGAAAAGRENPALDKNE